MATQWISPTWRMPENSNQSKLDNYSLSFDGTEFINVGVAPELDLTSALSISAWVTFDDFVGTGGIFENQISSGGNIGYKIFRWNNELKFQIQGTAIAYNTQTGGTIPQMVANTWYHIICTWDGSTSKMYINNTEVASGSVSSVTYSSNLVMIGKNQPYSGTWEGRISNISVFDYALSENQIKYLYNNNDTVNPTVANPQNPMAIPGNTPIAYYDLGGSSTGDAAASSPNTLTVPNSSVPSATVFDITGSGQLIDLGGSNLWSNILVGTNRTGVATFSSWVKGPFTGYHRIWEMGVSGQDLLRVGTNQKLYYRFGSGSIYRQWTMPSGVDLDSSSWLHIVLVFKAGSVTDASGTAVGNGVADIDLFINGDLCSQSLLSAGASANTWGGGSYGIRNYSGQQLTERSNVQIWNSELTASEIETLYNNGSPYLGTQPQSSNLKGWWRLNIDTSNWDGSDWIIGDSTANYTTALEGDGVNTHIDLTSVQNLTSEFSLSIWVKPDALNFTQVILGNDALNWIRLNSASQITFRINGNNPGAENFNAIPGINLVPNVWQHLFFNRDSSNNIRVYRNGSLFSSNVYNQSDTFSIGKIASRTGVYYNGKISNVQIFNTALPATGSNSVETLYNNGTPLNDMSGFTSLVGWWKLDNLTTGIQDQGSGSNNGVNSGMVEVDSFVSTLNGESSGMTTANLVNSDLGRSISYSSYSMYMTGSTDDTYFDLNTDIVVGTAGNTTYSWSIWVKPVDDGFTSQVVVFGDSGATDDGSLVLERSGGNFTALVEQTGTELESSAGAVINNAWTHIAIVVDSTASTKKMYINGQEDTAVGGTGAGPDGTIKNINSSNTFNQYTGYVSNWAFWNSALSDADILSIYNGGAPNDLTNLNPTHWWSMSGDSYFNGNDWTCPDLIGSNNLTGVNDSGEELVGDGPGSEANGVGTNTNIPSNLQGNAPNSTANAFSINMTAADRVEDVAPTP